MLGMEKIRIWVEKQKNFLISFIQAKFHKKVDDNNTLMIVESA